jgi:peroxin-12
MGDLRPSFFELYAAERLTSALRPALRYALEVFSVRNPTLMPLAARSDDIFVVASLFLETTNLSTSASTLAESFYSLRRSRVATQEPSKSRPTGLSLGQIFASVVLSVIVPHVKLKLDEAYSARSGGPLADLMRSSRASTAARSESPPRPAGSEQCKFRVPRSVRELAALLRAISSRLRVENNFLRWYPVANAVYEGVALLFNAAYLFGHTRYFNASFALQRLVVRRLTPREGAAASMVQPSTTAGAVLSVARHAAIATVFAYRFLEYYFAAEGNAPRQGAVVPPPPAPLAPARGIDINASSSQSRIACPLCEQPRVSPTACVVSGYVFCYSCIVAHLDKHGRCPVTLLPAKATDLVRVMS